METRWSGVDRIAVIGNGGGGKTTLSRALSRLTGLPCHEVDQIQFRPGWELTPSDEVEQHIDRVIAESRWILDGFGPWSTIERRAARADVFVFIDFPVWIHFWWAAERQLAAARGEERVGGPDGCPLAEVTREVFRAIGRVDQELTPKLRELTQQLKHRGQTVVVEIHAPEQLTALMEEISRESS